MGQIVSTANSAAAGTLSPVGVGIGSAVIAATLVVLLAYLEIATAADSELLTGQQSLLKATISPLLVAFSGTVLFESLVILEVL